MGNTGGFLSEPFVNSKRGIKICQDASDLINLNIGKAKTRTKYNRSTIYKFYLHFPRKLHNFFKEFLQDRIEKIE